jgi:hypothetical protein
MTQQPSQLQGAATDAAVRTLAANPRPNLHFGWACVDVATQKLIVAFLGTEFLHDWLDNFNFIPAPYAPIPERGTVHEGFNWCTTPSAPAFVLWSRKKRPDAKTCSSPDTAWEALAAPSLLLTCSTTSPLFPQSFTPGPSRG